MFKLGRHFKLFTRKPFNKELPAEVHASSHRDSTAILLSFQAFVKKVWMSANG